MKILYAASEAAPYAKSGGLADVAGALPKALVHDGIDCRVIMPLYGDLKFKDTLTYVTNFSVPVGWRSQYCGLFKAEHDGVTFYFIDNEYYFKRSGLYGFYDDGERFAFFSRAFWKPCSIPTLSRISSTATTGRPLLPRFTSTCTTDTWTSSTISRRYSPSITLPTRASMAWISWRIPAALAHAMPTLWSMMVAPTL